jgi:hypothetical protein
MTLKYFIAWFGIIFLAIANGAIREFGYKSNVGDLLAHQISTFILILLIALYTWQLNKFWPIKSARQAWIIGSIWIIMTIAFEFGMGHFISEIPLSKMLSEYNIFAGRLWILIPLWTFFAPFAFFRLTRSN